MLFSKQNILYVLVSFQYITFLYDHKSKILSNKGVLRLKSSGVVYFSSAEQARVGLNTFDFERP